MRESNISSARVAGSRSGYIPVVESHAMKQAFLKAMERELWDRLNTRQAAAVFARLPVDPDKRMIVLRRLLDEEFKPEPSDR